MHLTHCRLLRMRRRRIRNGRLPHRSRRRMSPREAAACLSNPIEGIQRDRRVPTRARERPERRRRAGRHPCAGWLGRPVCCADGKRTDRAPRVFGRRSHSTSLPLSVRHVITPAVLLSLRSPLSRCNDVGCCARPRSAPIFGPGSWRHCDQRAPAAAHAAHRLPRARSQHHQRWPRDAAELHGRDFISREAR